MEENAAAIWVSLERLNHVIDLIDGSTILRWPRSPLLSINRPEIPLLRGPLIPNADTIFVEPFHVRIATEHPDQLIGNAFEMQLFGG
ncbi:hypothetical protein D3C79_1012740 [compost metagenome]